MQQLLNINLLLLLCNKLDFLSLQDHIYHVLENQKIPSFRKLDSPIPEQPPIYQEVAQIFKKGEATNSNITNDYACIH